ncbi:MAG: CBS domain-containing protein [Phycisphaera sp.]|nr:CBS domain-containing protein [Phycisphaera sp.]
MLIRDGMTRPVVTVAPEMLLPGVASMLRDNRIHQLPVVDGEGVLVGIVTDRDVRDARAVDGFDNRSVQSIMTPNPVSVRETDTLEDALLLLHRRRFGALPVVDTKNRVVGIFARHDCLRVLVEVLGLEQPGSRIELHIDKADDDLCKAVGVLGKLEASLVSAVVTREHTGEGRRVYLRLQTIDPTPARKAMQRSGLRVIEPGD